MPKEKNPIDFEKPMEKLNQLVEKMEHGNLPLENSLKYFEQGIGLIRQCQEALSKAEQRVKILIQNNGEETLENFNSNE